MGKGRGAARVRAARAGLVAAVAALVGGGDRRAHADPPAPESTDAQPYALTISGGVSLNARDNLRAQERDANVKMVFALNTGNYLSDVHVRVTDGKGNVVIDDVSNGPWVLAKLPPGNYTANATYNGKTVTQRFSAGKSGLRTAHFRWPASVEAIGSTDAAAGNGQILGTGPQEPQR